MSKNSKLLFLSTTLVAIIIALIGTSYAFFTSEVIGNDAANQTVITSGNLAVSFSDGLEVSKSDMVPGESVTKTFSVENTGTNELKYDIYFSEICNLFVNNNDLVYTLTSTNNGYSVSEPTPVPTTPSKLVDSQTIGAGVTQEYTLTITFVNANYDQSNEMGAYFSTKLNINDYKKAKICSKYNNTVKYYVNNEEVQDIPSNIGYLYSTSSCTNNATITWDNTNWNYDVDYNDSTADSVCSINFTPKLSKLTIDANGGTWNSYTDRQEYNLSYKQKMSIPDPSKEGYTFVNWTVSGGETSLNNQELTMGYEESSLVANYTINQYTLTINPDGGEYSGNKTITQDYGTSTTLGTPTKSGYTFKGWTNPSFGTLSSSIYKFGAGNETITATYTPITYTISYTLNSGSCSSCPSTYTIESNNFTLPTPTRSDYVFTGWTGSNGSTEQKSVTIAKGSMGNKTYTANWKKTLYSTILAKEASSISSHGSKSPTFTAASTTDEGVYKTTDDLGTVYYYRGKVQDNYVMFGGFCWRVVRTNGDQSVRLIYQGTTCSKTGANSAIGNYKYNTARNNNAYVGYMYTSGQAHGVGTNSNAKTQLESWYSTNLSSYDSYIEDQIFCVDRQPSTSTTTVNGKGGTSTTRTYYAPYIRTNSTHKPVLTCTTAADKFTKTSANGNQKLSQKIGMLTVDEVIMAGGYIANNTSYYLYTGANWWLGSPNYYNSYAYIYYINTNGYVNTSYVTQSFGLRPVISLKSSALVSSGSGTKTSPWVIKTS